MHLFRSLSLISQAVPCILCLSTIIKHARISHLDVNYQITKIISIKKQVKKPNKPKNINTLSLIQDTTKQIEIN